MGTGTNFPENPRENTMRSFVQLSLLAAACGLQLHAAPTLAPTWFGTHAAPARVAPLSMQEKPFRSDEQFDYFRRASKVEVTLAKPLGAVLQEAKPAGVMVGELQEGGSALETGLLKKGDRLRSVQGEDVSKASFDEVMEKLIDAPEEVALDLLRFIVVRKPRIAPTLTVDGTAGIVEKGVIMRTALQEAGVEVHRGMKAKLSQCGGGGQCGTCWVNVVDGMDNLSDKTPVELKMGAKKPETYRLSCQAFVNGDASVEVS